MQNSNPYNGKGKVAPVLFNWASRFEGVLGSGGTAPHILDLGTRQRWVVNFAPWPLLVPIGYDTGWAL